MTLQNMSMSLQSLRHLSWVLDRYAPRRVLELGSGESTLWLARAVSVQEVVSIEEDLDTHNRTYHRLLMEGPAAYNKVMVYHVHADNVFYDLKLVDEVAAGTFDLILVDGPSGSHRRSQTLLKFLKRHSHDSTIFVIDDCHRTNERKVVEALTDHAKPRTRLFVDEVDDRPDRLHIRSTAFLIP